MIDVVSFEKLTFQAKALMEIFKGSKKNLAIYSHGSLKLVDILHQYLK